MASSCDWRNSKKKYIWKVRQEGEVRKGVSINKDPDKVHGQNGISNLGGKRNLGKGSLVGIHNQTRLHNCFSI